jgi:hypothetical protein
MGIFFFAITYGLIEIFNAFHLHRTGGLSKYGLFAITFWGVCIAVLSLGEIFRFRDLYQNIFYILLAYPGF